MERFLISLLLTWRSNRINIPVAMIWDAMTFMWRHCTMTSNLFTGDNGHAWYLLHMVVKLMCCDINDQNMNWLLTIHNMLCHLIKCLVKMMNCQKHHEQRIISNARANWQYKSMTVQSIICFCVLLSSGLGWKLLPIHYKRNVASAMLVKP